MALQIRRVIGTAPIAVVLCLLLPTVVMAQVPEIETPKPLQPFANTQSVLKTAADVIDLLGSAKFALREKAVLTSDCETDEYRSIIRGYQLMKTAYFIFTSKIERGWYDPGPPPGWYDTPPAESIGFINPNRFILIRVWNAESLSKAGELVARLAGLPPPVKVDLATFFGKLRDFKKYHGFLTRRPDELSAIKKRVADQCDLQTYHYLEALEKGKAQDYGRDKVLDRTTAKQEYDMCQSRRLNSPETESKAYRELINGVRDPDFPAISACLDGPSGYYGTTTLGNDGAISKESMLNPTYYMVRFWERRQAEGTTMLAEFFLSRILDALK